MRARRSAVWMTLLALAASTSPVVAGGSVGARVDLLPPGRLEHEETFFGGSTVETAKTYALAATAAYDVLPNLSLGVAPRLVSEVRQRQDAYAQRGRQLDVLAIVEAHGHVGHHVRLITFVTGGYSHLAFEPAAGGLAIGGGVAAERDLGNQIFVRLELGYQLSYHRTSYERGFSGNPEPVIVTETNNTRLLHIGAGAGRRF